MKTFDPNHSLSADVAEVSRMTVGALSILAAACAGALGFLEALVR
ncbi:MAG: hypothetical protein U1E56_02800 [Bauldia sp.]